MQLTISSSRSYLQRDDDHFLFHHNDKQLHIPSQNIESIIISSETGISFDAILLALEKDIEIHFLDHLDEPIWKIGNVKANIINNSDVGT